jgi:hypothetical protein
MAELDRQSMERTGQPAFTPEEWEDARRASVVQPPMDPDELAVHNATGAPVEQVEEPTAADSADYVTTVERADIPGTETEEVVTAPREQRFFDWGGAVGKVPLLFRDQIKQRERQDQLDRKELIDTRTPEFQEALSKMSPVSQAIIKMNIGEDGLMKNPGVGSLSATLRSGAMRRYVVNGQPTTMTDAEAMERQDAGDDVQLAAPAPPMTPDKKWVAVTELATGQRVRITEDEWNNAPPGKYSDIKPPSSSIRKADPAKLNMAYEALGGPGVKDSLWELAVAINKDKGLWTAIKGMGVEGLATLTPQIASQSGNPATVLASKYIRQVKGFASSIAKAFGEAGVLTNQDIQRAVNLFPRIGESPETTLDALNRVKAVMEAGRGNNNEAANLYRSIFNREPPAEGEGAPAAPGSGPTPPPGFRIRQ